MFVWFPSYSVGDSRGTEMLCDDDFDLHLKHLNKIVLLQMKGSESPLLKCTHSDVVKTDIL